MKKKLYYFLSFLIPIIVVFIISTILKFYPIYDNTFLFSDSNMQYSIFMKELGDMLRSGKTIFYSLHGALGTDFLSIIYTYLGTPLNLLIYFFKGSSVYLFMTILIYIKIGLSGLFMYYYLNSLNTKYKNSLWNITFSLIYSLSGFVVAYKFHIMWMNAYLLLPLIIRKLDKLILERKGYGYTLLLSLSIIINYYTGYMICIFMIIYFIYKSIITNNLNKKSIYRFLKYSIFAGLISMVVLLPIIYSLKNGRFTMKDEINYLSIDYLNLFSQIYNMSMGSYIIKDNKNLGTNTIFTTLFSISLIIQLFFNKDISKKEKVTTFIILLFFQISFSFRLIDYAWNMFKKPVWWNHRYQFVYIFLIIIIAYKSFCYLNNSLNKKHKYIISLIFSLLLICSFLYKRVNGNFIYYIITLISILLFIIYTYKLNNKYIFIILISLELIVNAFVSINVNKGVKYSNIINNYNKYENIFNNIDDKDNYRIVVAEDKNLNIGFLNNINTLNLFSSIYNSNVLNSLNKFNIVDFNTKNRIKIVSYNPAILSLLGVKYFIGSSDYFPCQEGICNNDFAMPFIYNIDSNLKKLKLKDNYLDNINNIYSMLLDKDVKIIDKIKEENIEYKDIEVENNELKFDDSENARIIIRMEADKDYILVLSDYFDIDIIKINDKDYEIKNDYLITLKKGDKIEIITKLYDDFTYTTSNVVFPLIDKNNYEFILKQLKEANEYAFIIDNRYILKGNIKVNNNHLLITLPYYDSYKIEVDNKLVNYYKILDTFIGIDVENGYHEIKVSYRPKGLKLGFMISVGTFIIFNITELYSVYKKEKKNS